MARRRAEAAARRREHERAGESAARRPWRAALSCFRRAFGLSAGPASLTRSRASRPRRRAAAPPHAHSLF
ncbi:hypothetical protein BMA721280_L0397 [Burkholderia mallei 2002721280]|uniref:Uncharacterized protein n=1 Tax=Burkholderia mallei (strain NCTC 10229) TaxID=412022 RepID=A2RWM5_BURM9|nr:hypothetical protein BMA10229_0270 [Burkholderia mallei NCTC 10229]EDK83882.1 hypothetical protein BMA721280_L0397 [Burkholderia mallei 2002721280]